MSSLKVLREVLLSSSIKASLEAIQEHYNLDYATFHLLNNAKKNRDNPFVRTTYPDAWVTYYLLNNFIQKDPVIAHTMEVQQPFNWTEVEPSEEGMEVLVKSMEYDLGQSGFSSPYVDGSGRFSVLSVNSHMPPDEWTKFLDKYSGELIQLTSDIHVKALSEVIAKQSDKALLSPRECECLRWAAEGKTYSEIAIILDLSDHTIRSYLKVARIKLNSVSLAQAVAKAGHMGLI